jgi:hypothetical protein
MGRRRCCCGCTIFTDNFDRGGPTQTIGLPWDWANADGEWWIDASTQPKYPDDSALYEVTGTGEIIGPKAPEWDEGHGVSYDIIDEQVGNRYRIIFGAPEDPGRPGVPPLPGCDCIIAEYEVGELTTPPTATSAIRVYSRVGGVETLLKEKLIPPQAVNSQNGRRFYAWHINTHDDGTFCVWIGSSAYPSQVTLTGITPPGLYFGAANRSKDELPIEIDDYTIDLATWETVNGERQPCFACICVCYDYEDDDPDANPTPIARALYPGVLHLRIVGECCTPIPVFWPCGTCPSAVDETIDLEYENDYPTVGYNGWYNHTDLTICGYPFQFRIECDATGILTLGMYYKPYLGAAWQEIVQGAAITLELDSHTCEPIYEHWTLTLASLSGFPCCLSCSTGSYEIEIWA